MNTRAVMPEDILPDEINSKIINNIPVRKGTIGAALRNADILASETASDTLKESALQNIRTLAPGLIALKMHEHVVWKNKSIENIINNEINKLTAK